VEFLLHHFSRILPTSKFFLGVVDEFTILAQESPSKPGAQELSVRRVTRSGCRSLSGHDGPLPPSNDQSGAGEAVEDSDLTTKVHLYNVI
jgi:hypothetical protein